VPFSLGRNWFPDRSTADQLIGVIDMKYFYLLLLFILATLFFNTLAIAQKSVETFNGEDWNKSNGETKIAYVTGFMSGTSWVACNSQVPESLFGDKQTFERAKKLWEIITKEVGSQSPEKKIKYNASDALLFTMYDGYKKNSTFAKAIIKELNTNIVLELNKFYSDQENSVILISNAIFLVYKKLRGAPEDDIQILLPYLRGEKQIPPGWIVPVYDKNGKFIKIVEFP
jgi:hypothetical protein